MPTRPVPLLLALGLAPLVLLDAPRAAAAELVIEGAPLAPVTTAAPVTVLMRPSFELRGALRRLPTSLDEGPVVRLSVERVKAPGGATLRVFVNLPSATAETPTTDFHYVGGLTSFEDPAPDSPGDDFLLDAGRAFKRLKKGDRLMAGDVVAVTLVLAPETASADAAIPFGRVVLSIETQ